MFNILYDWGTCVLHIETFYERPSLLQQGKVLDNILLILLYPYYLLQPGWEERDSDRRHLGPGPRDGQGAQSPGSADHPGLQVRPGRGAEKWN